MIKKLNQSGIALLTTLFMLFMLSQKSYSQPVINPGPDLIIDVGFMMGTMTIVNHNFDQNPLSNPLHFEDDACMVNIAPNGDGCTEIASFGNKKLLSFGLKTLNIGTVSLVLGSAPQPYFEFSSCHDHNHFMGFVEYGLYDLCNDKRAGKKLGGAFYDCADPDDTECTAFAISGTCFPKPDCVPNNESCFTPDNQGLHAGCADIYVAYTHNSLIPGQ